MMAPSAPPSTRVHVQPAQQLHDERGATSVEYGLLVAMIAIVITGAVTFFGTGVVALYSIPAGIFSR